MVNVPAEYFRIWSSTLDKTKYVTNKIYTIIYALKTRIFTLAAIVTKSKIEDRFKKGDL